MSINSDFAATTFGGTSIFKILSSHDISMITGLPLGMSDKTSDGNEFVVTHVAK